MMCLAVHVPCPLMLGCVCTVIVHTGPEDSIVYIISDYGLKLWSEGGDCRVH